MKAIISRRCIRYGMSIVLCIIFIAVGPAYAKGPLEAVGKGVKKVGENVGDVMSNAIKIPANAGKAAVNTVESAGDENPDTRPVETAVEGVGEVGQSVGNTVKSTPQAKIIKGVAKEVGERLN